MPSDAPVPLQEEFESLMQRRHYDATIAGLLQELQRGAQHNGPGAVCAHLLQYVQRRNPWLIWSKGIGRLGFAGLTVIRPAGYAILLNPEYIQASPEGASTLAHELGHALWNSRGFDCSEEEYYCDRVGGKAYQEMLLAGGSSTAEAEQRAAQRFLALVQSREEWVTARRQKVPRHLLRPWSWFDYRYAADVTANIALGPWVNLGLLGDPAWLSKRKLLTSALIAEPGAHE